MEVCVNVWECAGVCENVWECVGVCGSVWKCMKQSDYLSWHFLKTFKTVAYNYGGVQSFTWSASLTLSLLKKGKILLCNLTLNRWLPQFHQSRIARPADPISHSRTSACVRLVPTCVYSTFQPFLFQLLHASKPIQISFDQLYETVFLSCPLCASPLCFSLFLPILVILYHHSTFGFLRIIC